jgi:hypothetical protein
MSAFADEFLNFRYPQARGARVIGHATVRIALGRGNLLVIQSLAEVAELADARDSKSDRTVTAVDNHLS